jgi:hypothetical protein
MGRDIGGSKTQLRERKLARFNLFEYKLDAGRRLTP